MKQTHETSVGDNPAKKKLPRRRWFQFSLRTLLLMMLVFGCGLGWFTAKRRQAQQAWKRIADAEKQDVTLYSAGDDVYYGKISHQGTRFEQWLGISMPTPPECAKISLSRYNSKEAISQLANFPVIADIRVNAVSISDDDFELLAGEKRLTTLYIALSSPLNLTLLTGMSSLVDLKIVSSRCMTDDAVQSIPDLPSLTILAIRDCPITGANLSHLATACPQLESLSLRNTKLNEHEMLELEKLSHLKQLDLMYTQLTDDGMAHLSEFQDLQELNLRSNRIGDRGLLHIQSKRLEVLYLRCTNITDSSVSLFTRFPLLRRLNLGETKVTDASMPVLASLSHIEIIDLSDTKITDAALHHFSHHKTLQQLNLPKQLDGTPGVTALRQANPKLVLQFF